MNTTMPSTHSPVSRCATIAPTQVEYSTNPAGPWTNITTSFVPVVNNTLAVWNTTAIAPGYYFVRLRAANDCGPTNTFVTVIGKCSSPTIGTQPAPESAQEGNRICLRVVSSTAFCSPSYQWQRNGVNLLNCPRISGVNTDELIIDPAQSSDAGNYRVILTNQCGSVPSAAAPVTITCRADFNGGGLSVQDIFDFLNAWFAGCP